MSEQTQPKLEKLTTEQVRTHPDGTPRGFFRGEHITLRPVLKEDLPALAGLLAEDPQARTRGPWTLARLEKTFADEKEPGMWKDNLRMFVALDPAGLVCGYASERSETGGIYFVQHWLALGTPGRQAAGLELVGLHTKWLTDWHAAQVIDTRVLASSAEQAAWLAGAGFIPDTLVPIAYWSDGALQDQQHYIWLSPARQADEPWSVGEPVSSAEADAVLDW
jgi:hypothetical protein